MSIISKVNSALEQEGLGYVIERVPHYIRWRVESKISEGVFRLYNPGKLTRADMISHCENNDQIWYYGSHDEFEIKPPITEPIPEPFEKLIGVQESPMSFVCELNDVRLVGDRAIPQTKEGKFVLEEMGTDSMLKSRLTNTFASLNTREKIQEISRSFSNKNNNYYSEPLINLVPRHGGEHNNYINYGHWVLEDLPRLRAYERYSAKTDRNPIILIKNDPPSWVTDTLRILGFSPSQWVEWNNERSMVETLVIPKLSYIHSFGAEFQPSDRAWVAEQMKSRVDFTKTGQFSKRIFMSRQGQDRRKIVNFDEVINLLRDYGFESFRPEEMSIKNQIKLHNQAEIIVGPFGSNLTGMIFADKSSVLEIKPFETGHTVFYLLANEFDLRYSLLHGEPVRERGASSGKDSDIIVDVNKLDDKVKSMIERQ